MAKMPIINTDNFSGEHQKHLWNQFVRLGDMMGDGLHHEPDGKWIVREYNKLAKILMPEIREAKRAKREAKMVSTDKQMAKLLEGKKCKCGGDLRQARSGSIIAYCKACNSRYKATKKKI